MAPNVKGDIIKFVFLLPVHTVCMIKKDLVEKSNNFLGAF